MAGTDYTKNFQAFMRDLYPVEGGYGPRFIIPPFLSTWLQLAFPAPDGHPSARNVMDLRTKKEGKSALAGGVSLYMATRQPYSEVYIVAADQDQSRDRVLRSVKYAVENGPLASSCKVYRDVIELENKSIIQALSNDWQGAAGGNPSCVVFDELHAWLYESSRRLFDEMLIPPTRPNGVRWIASYAGFVGESELLWDWWQRALSGKRIDKALPIYRNDDASLLAFVDTGEASWRMPWITPAYIKETRETERLNTFRRLWLNEWTSNESGFLPEGAWDDCSSRDIKPLRAGDGRMLVFGADASTSRDYTALVGVDFNTDTGTVDLGLVRTWKPRKIAGIRMGKPTVDIENTLTAEVLRLHEAGQVRAVVCDPYQLHTSILTWERSGIKVIECAQTTGRTEADTGLYDAVIGHAIRHYNDPDLNAAIRDAVAVEGPRGLRLAKTATKLKIDCAVALSMAHWGAVSVGAGRSFEVVDSPFDFGGVPWDEFDPHDFAHASVPELVEMGNKARGKTFEHGSGMQLTGDERTDKMNFYKHLLTATPEGQAVMQRMQDARQDDRRRQQVVKTFYTAVKQRRNKDNG